VITNNKNEAIINSAQSKGLPEYHKLMQKCLSEYYRVLKPGHWITIEFHNSQNAVWNTIQEVLQKAGFVIANVRILDKGQGTYNQMTTNLAVKQDLVISAYKPKDIFKREFESKAGNEETVWMFVRQYLEKLSGPVVNDGFVRIIPERQAFLLFDRMVAYHIMNGTSVPIDAVDFYIGLKERFIERDGMYFLTGQVNEYDAARVKYDVEYSQFDLYVSNEKSAIAWLNMQLLLMPQTYQDLQPKFMQECKPADKHEKIPELSEMLEENFLNDDYGKYYIPDVTKSSDVVKLREKRLQKEFESYLETKGKLKEVRTEAIRAGFAKLWTENNYQLIVDTAERLPEKVIAEDDKLLMYVDLSSGRV